jgi:hypothetical protein
MLLWQHQFASLPQLIRLMAAYSSGTASSVIGVDSTPTVADNRANEAGG